MKILKTLLSLVWLVEFVSKVSNYSVASKKVVKAAVSQFGERHGLAIASSPVWIPDGCVALRVNE